MEDIFDANTAHEYINRINRLSAHSERKWGTMTVDQMLAHCNVAYELVYEPEKHRKPGIISSFLMRNFVKPKTVNQLPYRQNLPTGPMFKILGYRDFEKEKARLIGYIQKTQQLGREAFDGKKSHSFGPLKAHEWNNLFAKHLNHHLSQFNV